MMNDTQAHCCTGPVDDRQLQDPVCGMRVMPRSPFRYPVLDKTYYFCSEDCMNQFAGSATGPSDHGGSPDPHAALKDPVCGMSVAADSPLKRSRASWVLIGSLLIVGYFLLMEHGAHLLAWLPWLLLLACPLLHVFRHGKHGGGHRH
jgi:YHS domain-containing protein